MVSHSGLGKSRKWETSGGTPEPASSTVGFTASLMVGWCCTLANDKQSATPSASCLTVGEGGEAAKLERGTLASEVVLSNRPGWGEGCWERRWLMCGWRGV